ncbi:cCA-adding enzyme [Firmicutes bacterium CAG:460]|nr:cCA-adding enzyme [Firmicutes bacterium CAG:460]
MEKNIKKILETLENEGYQAYLVGGYVRDYLLGVTSFDVDIATDALPKDIHRIFNSSKNNYGSVNIKVDKLNVDITTFRKDLNYVNRRPSKVVYINNLKDDLERRDFTINAICMNKNGKIIDLLNGCKDLDRRTIKMIGSIDVKLKEDPLRIMRAIRFACILDFKIEDELYEKIKEYSYLVGDLSKERIKNELDKILISKNYKYGLELMKDTKISEVLEINYDDINYVDDLLGMWAQVKVLNIPFTNVEKGNIIKITEVLDFGKIDNEILYKYGLYISRVAGKILNIKTTKISKMYNKLPIKSREDIDITSKEISSIVGVGEVIGETYKIIEKEILNYRLKNKKSEILKYLEKRK